MSTEGGSSWAERDRRTIRLVDSARESTDKAVFSGLVRSIEAGLEHADGAVWGVVETEVEAAHLTAEEKDSLRTAIDFLKSFKNLAHKEELLRRAARKLPEVAMAHSLFERISHNGDVGAALRHFFEAAATFASPEDREASRVILGGMTDEEVAAARDHASKMDIR